MRGLDAKKGMNVICIVTPIAPTETTLHRN